MGLWAAHFVKHPLGEDKRLHLLVAQILVLLMYWSGAAGKTRNVDVLSVAPWLAEPEAVRKREEEKDMAFATSMHAMALRDIMEA